jgi:hypothetical protein
MGALDDLALLLNGGSYQKPDYSADDPYKGIAPIGDSLTNVIAQGAIGGKGGYSNTENILGALATGLLSGAGTGLSTDYQIRAKDAYKDSLINSILGKQVEQPSVLGDKLFSQAKDNAGLFNLQRGQEQAQAAQKIKQAKEDDIFKAYLANPQRTRAALDSLTGANQAKPIASPIDGAVNEDAIYQKNLERFQGNETLAAAATTRELEKPSKDAAMFNAEADAARTELSKLPVVQKLNTTSAALAQIKDLKDLDTKSSDIPFATIFIGGLDGSTVREGEYARVGGSNPILTQYKNLLEGVLNGTSTLGVDIKRQMFNELASTQKGLLAEATTQAAPRLATAVARGLKDPNQALPFDPKRSFGEFPLNNVAPSSSISIGQTPVSTSLAQSIIADAKMKYGDTPQAKEMARQQLEAQRSPKAPSGVPFG